MDTERLRSLVQFSCENYIEKESAEKYDVILCMSTIKWVHHVFGDVGVKALFLKVFSQLPRGGLFIFEQQPWKTYKKLEPKSKTPQKSQNDMQVDQKGSPGKAPSPPKSQAQNEEMKSAAEATPEKHSE